VDELFEIRPRQFSPQCGDNVFIGKRFREPNHAKQISGRKAPA
jgi:hypothetical protein